MYLPYLIYFCFIFQASMRGHWRVRRSRGSWCVLHGPVYRVPATLSCKPVQLLLTWSILSCFRRYTSLKNYFNNSFPRYKSRTWRKRSMTLIRQFLCFLEVAHLLVYWFICIKISNMYLYVIIFYDKAQANQISHLSESFWQLSDWLNKIINPCILGLKV